MESNGVAMLVTMMIVIVMGNLLAETEAQKVVLETWDRCGKHVRDYNMYTGVLGTAYLLFKSYLVTSNQEDLKLCLEIVKACDVVASKDSLRVTFFCGYAGVCALGAVVAKCIGDDQLQDRYLTRFREIRLPIDLPYELLYGRVGYLWGCLFLNKHIGKDSVSSARMRFVVEEIFRGGRQLGKRGECPLMYEWHGKKYWGAAHGLAGIMHVLMHMELEPDEIEDVKGKSEYLYRAKAFASFLLDKSEKLITEGKMQGGDRPFSLFEGIGGMSYMFLDMIDPTQALFPGYEL
ncbi:hypothetical protein AALP_AA1G138200 [Arabis alpina]|uniref:Uncharacterized protein n=1 Tax=Arabis alpina TaxID=50452 RepID=A0A087HN28_ARAAL|nr:hypothetical protein AALP_AA1G138200 [Arabis alpina]